MLEWPIALPATWETLSGWDWGDIPTWVAGIATTAAVIAALVHASGARKHAVAALKVARDEAAAREVARQDELAGQARLLMMTYTKKSGGLEFDVANHSAAPLFTIEVKTAYFMGGGAPSEYLWRPWRQNPRHKGLTRDVLPAGQTHHVSIQFCDAQGEVIPSLAGFFALEVSYVDAHGVRWRRRGNVLPRRDPPSAGVHGEPVYWPLQWGPD